jgi:polyhydroxybutyrate depolymerase
MMRRWVASLLACAVLGTAADAGCDGAPEPCGIANGTYHLERPAGISGPVPAIFLLHGYGGDGAGMIRNGAMLRQMLARGYAVIAPDGQRRGDGRGRSWDFHPDRPSTRDEVAFLTAVADHATVTHGLDRGRILLAGFSIGGSLASYVACQAPDAFAAYAPVAGSFWQPLPSACAGPVRLMHMHGTADRTVPLAGRQIRPGFAQGDVFDAMQVWRSANTCPDAAPEEHREGIFGVGHWAHCAPGTDLRLVLHDGGHSIPKGWAGMAMDWFETP